MKRLLFDVNVVLDVLLNRQPHAEASAAVWASVEAGESQGMLAAHALTTIHYLLRQQMSVSKTRATIASLFSVFKIAAVDEGVIHEALQATGPDLEDSVTAAAAHRAKCDFVVTRDPLGFRASLVRPVTPEAVIPLLGRSSRS